MKVCVFVSMVLIFYSANVSADEVSLIERDDFQVKPQIKTGLNTANNQDLASEEMEDDAQIQEDGQDQDFTQMNDFIHKENEKFKDIKLLNLDVEKFGLELKKKEIEQKIAQLNKSKSFSSIPGQSDQKALKSNVKLIGIFESATKKQAVLNIDGIDINAQEGENIGGMVIKTINHQAVIVQYQDGNIQELRLL